jgi:hypothetical protein
MPIVLTNTNQNSTTKRIKEYLTHPAIDRKVIAFHEIVTLKHHKKSFREAAAFLEVPYSTMQSWRNQGKSREMLDELAKFLSTPAGKDFLQQNILAVMKLMKCGPGGIRGMQEYLHNSKLNYFVASSEGALQNFWVRCEKHIVLFGETEEKKLALKMRHRKITAGLDEMFRGGRPCLVAIEVVSNYILLEKFTEDRTANTWIRELAPRLKDLNIGLGQVVSDLCGAIRSATKDLGAEHISELFHALQEVSKGTSGSLSAQERASKNALDKAEEKVRLLNEKPLKFTKKECKKQKNESRDNENVLDELKIDFDKKAKRREDVKAAIREMSNIHHPINLKTGVLQTANEMTMLFNEQFKMIWESIKAAKLSESSVAHIKKAQRAFDLIVQYMKYFFIIYTAFVKDLQLDFAQEKFFNDVIFPLTYLQMIWRRLPKNSKKENMQLLRNLEARIRDASWSVDLISEWMKKGKELAERFQRSSSCVEGRNGMLSLNYHRFHRLNARSLKSLTIMHNFDSRRSDGTTAAERFFEAKHENLFDSLVANVRIPGRPQQQHHDKEKRLLGWEKRHAA